jgi:hypothetical protein
MLFSPASRLVGLFVSISPVSYPACFDALKTLPCAIFGFCSAL